MGLIERKNEIWIVTYFFGSVKAGPVIRFMRYAKHFKEHGYELVFYTKLRKDKTSMSHDNSFPSVYIECDSVHMLTKSTLALAKESPLKPKALIFFSLSYKSYFSLRFASRQGLRLIYVSTMKLDLMNRNRKRRSFIRRFILSFVLSKVYSTMNFIVSSTSELQKDLINLKLRKAKLKVITNGVDCSKFKPISKFKKDQIRDELNLSKSPFVFLYVGLFVDRKGVLELLEIFKELDRINNSSFILLMVGHEMELKENSIRFINIWPNEKKRAMDRGWLVTRSFSNNVEKYYQAADAFVFNSKLEGMPNVLIEAMSSGLPVVTSKFNGFCNDYGKEGEHYLSFKHDKTEDLNTLMTLMNKKEIRVRYAENARHKALKDFAVQNSISGYISLFKEPL